jgi:ABC-type transport system involved in multi-copper enzyme maturation permease subunit
MNDRAVPSTPTMIWTLCGLTLRRLTRGKTLWIGGMLAALEVIYALAIHVRRAGSPEDQLFVLSTLLLVLLPAMFVGAAIGDDLEGGSSTYLWSRPLARWTVLASKLCALTPIVILLIVASWVAGVASWTGDMPPARTGIALAAGCIATSVVTAGITTVVPRHGMALTIGYMLADLFFGAMPFSLAELTITHQVRTLAGLSSEPSIAAPVVAMALIAAVWGAIGVSRIRRLEV